MEKITEQIFIIRPTQNEQDEYIITIGQHLATEKRFKTKEDAEKYIKYPKWDTTLALISEIMEQHEKREKEQDNKVHRDGSK